MAVVTRVPVIGGPADGIEIPRAGFLRWIHGGRGYGKPGAGRALYRWARDRYEFTGWRSWLCSCGALVMGCRGRCPLCGVPRVFNQEEAADASRAAATG